MPSITKVVCLALICLGAIVAIGSAFPQDIETLFEDAGIEYAEVENLKNIKEGEDELTYFEHAVEEIGPQLRTPCGIVYGTAKLCHLRCLALGNKGGYCNAKRVCVCRK